MRIGIVIGIGEAYGRQVCRGIAEFARDRRDWFFSGKNIDFLEPLGHLPDWRGDGIILSAKRGMLPKLPAGIPAVNVSEFHPDIPLPTVLPDNVQIGRTAAWEFINLGFRHLAYVTQCGHHYARQRWEGFAEVARSRGITPHRVEIVPESDAWWAGCARDLLELGRRVERLPTPLGVFCSRDERAAHLMQALRHLGRMVPEEVAVLGVDNDQLVDNFLRPRLSSIDPNAYGVGFRAAELLEKLMAAEAPPRAPVLVPHGSLIRRPSTDILAIEDEELAAALRYIRDHAGEAITVHDVLEHVAVSRSSLERKFRHYLQRTPLEEIRRVHLSRARELLADTRQPIPEVARNSGFTRPERLAAVFRKHLGQTPTEYRKSRQG